MAGLEVRRYNPDETRIYFYCFETGPEIDDPAVPGKKRKDTPGQRVMLAEWRADTRVFCPRCRRLLIFDGETLYNNVDGKPHYWMESEGGILVPKGHLFRYDLKGNGYVSPRYISPKPGQFTQIDFQKEYERIQRGESQVAVQSR